MSGTWRLELIPSQSPVQTKSLFHYSTVSPESQKSRTCENGRSSEIRRRWGAEDAQPCQTLKCTPGLPWSSYVIVLLVTHAVVKFDCNRWSWRRGERVELNLPISRKTNQQDRLMVGFGSEFAGNYFDFVFHSQEMVRPSLGYGQSDKPLVAYLRGIGPWRPFGNIFPHKKNRKNMGCPPLCKH